MKRQKAQQKTNQTSYKTMPLSSVATVIDGSKAKRSPKKLKLNVFPPSKTGLSLEEHLVKKPTSLNLTELALKKMRRRKGLTLLNMLD